MRSVAHVLAIVLLVSACGETVRATGPSAAAATKAAPTPSLARSTPPGTTAPALSPTPAPATPSPVSTANQTPCQRDLRCTLILDHINSINPYKLDDHLNALTSFVSRDPRHPGHARAVAYIKEQLNALVYYGWRIESQRTVYQGIPLENIFATIDPAPGPS